jgi:predicted RNA-binding protein with PUA-like domain
MAYWLFKSEPDEYSIDDLVRDGTEPWDGIRNYQARNFLRDGVEVGDEVLIYHSACARPAVAGTAVVSRAAYPDPAQFNPESRYYDPKATSESPRWVCVDVTFQSRFDQPIALSEIKQMPELSDMVLVRQGRLSIQPVTPREWDYIITLSQGGG